MKQYKLFYLFCMLSTLVTGGAILYGYATTSLGYIIYPLPVFAATYPVTVIGTAALGLKQVLEKKSLFDLMSMAGGQEGGSPMAGLGGLGQPETEKEEEKDEDEEK